MANEFDDVDAALAAEGDDVDAALAVDDSTDVGMSEVPAPEAPAPKTWADKSIPDLLGEAADFISPPAPVIEDLEEEKEAKDVAVYDALSVMSDPDKTAAVKRLASMTGVSERYATDNFDRVKRSWEASQFNARKWREESPEDARIFAKRPDLAGVVGGTEHLTTFAKALRGAAALTTAFGEEALSSPGKAALSVWPPSAPLAALHSIKGMTEKSDELSASIGKPGGALARDLSAAVTPQWVETLDDQRSAAGKEAGTFGRAVMRFEDKRLESKIAGNGFLVMLDDFAGSDTRELEATIADDKRKAGNRNYLPDDAGTADIIAVSSADVAGSFATQAEGFIPGAIIGGAVGIPGGPPGIGAGVLAGGKAAAAVAMFPESTGSAYLQLRDTRTEDGKLVDREVAMGGAILSGLIESGSEAISFGQSEALVKSMFKGFAGGNIRSFISKKMVTDPAFRAGLWQVTTNYFKVAGTEGIVEEIPAGIGTGYTEAFARTYSRDGLGGMTRIITGEAPTVSPAEEAAGMSLEDPGEGAASFPPEKIDSAKILKDAASQGATALEGMLGIGVILGGGQVTMDFARSAAARVHNEAVSTATVVGTIAIANSPLGVADPAAAIAEIRDIHRRETGKSLDAYHAEPDDVVNLFQDEKEMEAALGAEAVADVKEAIATGGKVRIPLEDFVARWAKIEGAERLSKIISTHPGLDGEERSSAREKANAEEVAKITKEYEADTMPAPQTGEQAFRDAVSRQLAAAGGYTLADARMMAAPLFAGIRNLANRMPNPAVAWERMTLRVSKEGLVVPPVELPALEKAKEKRLASAPAPVTPEAPAAPVEAIPGATPAVGAPGAVVALAVTGFKTEMGSSYVVHADGTTERNKAARSTPGHEGDSGAKPRAERTIYFDINPASLSVAGLTMPTGAKPLVSLRDGKATLSWNVGGKRGASASATSVPFSDTPKVGSYPLELWKRDDSELGYESYSAMHAGSAIVGIDWASAPAKATVSVIPSKDGGAALEYKPAVESLASRLSDVAVQLRARPDMTETIAKSIEAHHEILLDKVFERVEAKDSTGRPLFLRDIAIDINAKTYNDFGLLAIDPDPKLPMLAFIEPEGPKALNDIAGHEALDGLFRMFGVAFHKAKVAPWVAKVGGSFVVPVRDLEHANEIIAKVAKKAPSKKFQLRAAVVPHEKGMDLRRVMDAAEAEGKARKEADAKPEDMIFTARGDAPVAFLAVGEDGKRKASPRVLDEFGKDKADVPAAVAAAIIKEAKKNLIPAKNIGDHAFLLRPEVIAKVDAMPSVEVMTKTYFKEGSGLYSLDAWTRMMEAGGFAVYGMGDLAFLREMNDAFMRDMADAVIDQYGIMFREELPDAFIAHPHGDEYSVGHHDKEVLSGAKEATQKRLGDVIFIGTNPKGQFVAQYGVYFGLGINEDPIVADSIDLPADKKIQKKNKPRPEIATTEEEKNALRERVRKDAASGRTVVDLDKSGRTGRGPRDWHAAGVFGRDERAGVREGGRGVETGSSSNAPEVARLDQRAFHGSSTLDIRKFVLDKVGSATGMSTHGWGIYFGQNKSVADQYPSGGMARNDDGKLVALKVKAEDRRTYEVEVPDTVELLDLDANISDQPPGILAKIESIGGADMRGDGNTFYRKLTDDLGSKRAASERLREAGIPGSVYDGPKEGKRGIVIWDESKIDIIGPDGVRLEQRAYHGSPVGGIANFDINKIGEGEGAAKFGWGFYFAQNKEVAQGYKEKFAQTHTTLLYDGKMVDVESGSPGERAAKSIIRTALVFGRTGEDARAYAMRQLDAGWDPGRDAPLPELDKWEKARAKLTISGFSGSDLSIKNDKPSLYEIDLPEFDELVNLDAMVSEQTPAMLAKIDAVSAKSGIVADPDGTAWDFYKALVEALGGKKQASLAFKDAGVPGHYYFDAKSRAIEVRGMEPSFEDDYTGPTRNFVIWDESRIRVVEQLKSESGGATLGFTEKDAKNLSITLTPKADLSTFLHETAHVFHWLLADLAARPDAPQSIKDDWAASLRYMGVEEGKTPTREQYEKFARAFERYLYEGKAPSEKMRSPFLRYSLWLRGVYRTLAGSEIDVQLSDEVIGVFDRLLASDEEITRQANEPRNVRMFASAEEAGMTPDKWEEYVKTADAEVLDAARRTELAMLKEHQRITEDWWKTEERRERELARFEYRNLPAVVADRKMRGLDENGVRIEKTVKIALNATAVREMLGTRDIPPGIFAIKDVGLTPDDAATLLGFPTGRALVDALAARKPEKEWVKETAAARMNARHPDLLANRERLSNLVSKMLMGDEAKVPLALRELNIVRAKAGLPPARAENLKASARNIVAKKPVGPLSYRTLDGAANRSAVVAAKAVGAKKWEEAAAAKSRHVLDHYIAKEARDVVKRRDAFLSLVGRLKSEGSRAKIGKVSPILRDAVDGILGAIGESDLMAPLDLAAADAYLEEIGATVGFDYAEVEAALKSLPDEEQAWRVLPVDKFDIVGAALKSIAHIAGEESLRIVRGKRVDADANREARMAAARAASKKAWELSSSESAETTGEEIIGFLDSADAVLKKVYQMMLKLDGGKIDGIWVQSIYEPLFDAIGNENAVLTELTRPVIVALEALSRSQDMTALIEGDFPTHMVSGDLQLKAPSRVFEIAMLLMNTGTEAGRKKVTEGRNITMDEIVAAANRHLTPETLKAIQVVLDANEKAWPAIAALEERDSGVVPPKQLPVETVTRHGTIKGYFHMVYDRRVETTIGQKEDANVMKRTFISAGTSHGHVKRLTGFVGAVSLDPKTIGKHLHDVAHDLSHREAIKSVARIFREKETQAAITAVHSKHHLAALNRWLIEVGLGVGATSQPSDPAHYKIIQAAKDITIFKAMAQTLTTPMGDVTNFPRAAIATDVKTWSVMKATAKFAASPARTVREIRAKSKYMAARASSTDRDTHVAVDGMLSHPVFSRAAVKALFSHDNWYMTLRISELATSNPIWLGRYQQGIDAGMSEEDAVRAADRVIDTVFTSKFTASMAQALRDKGLLGATQLFGGYWNTEYNIVAPMLEETFGYKTKLGRRALMGATALGYMAAAQIIDAFLTRGGPPEEEKEDPNAWLKWGAMRTGFGFLGLTPYTREFAGGLEAFFDNRQANPRTVGVGYLAGQLFTALRAAESEDEAKSILDTFMPNSFVKGRKVIAKAANDELPKSPLRTASEVVYGARENPSVNALTIFSDKEQ